MAADAAALLKTSQLKQSTLHRVSADYVLAQYNTTAPAHEQSPLTLSLQACTILVMLLHLLQTSIVSDSVIGEWGLGSPFSWENGDPLIIMGYP